MVLLDDVTEVFDLAGLDVGVMLGIVAVNRGDVGVALVDGDLLGNTMPAGSVAQEAQRWGLPRLRWRNLVKAEAIARGAALPRRGHTSPASVS